MLPIIVKASGFILVILLAYVLKQKGILTSEHGRGFSTILMTVTLPCALLVSTRSLNMSALLLIPMGLGIAGNLLLLGIGYLRGRHKEPVAQSQDMIQLVGYNIGTFAFPFVQSFFPASYLMQVILFDTGNALMVFGGNYTITSLVSRVGEQVTLKAIFKKLFRSVPFCTYLLCFGLSLWNITLPTALLTLAKLGADANPFVAMLTLGLMVDFRLSRQDLKELGQLIGLRVFASFLMLVCLSQLPIDLVIKKMLAICLIAPISVVTPLYARELGSESALPATVNSLSIAISIILMTVLILFVS